MDNPKITTQYGDPYVAVMYCNFIDVYNGGVNNQDETQGGGAIYFRKMKLYVAYGSFENCTCNSGYGGAIYCDVDSPLEMDTVVFRSCTSAPQYRLESSGGGAVAAKDRTTVDRCRFYDCICENQNEGIHGVPYIVALEQRRRHYWVSTLVISKDVRLQALELCTLVSCIILRLEIVTSSTVPQVTQQQYSRYQTAYCRWTTV